MTELVDILIIGFAAFALVVAIRVALQSAGLIGFGLLLRKPFSCDLCLSFWATVALMLCERGLPDGLTVFPWAVPAFASTGIAVLLVKAHAKLQ